MPASILRSLLSNRAPLVLTVATANRAFRISAPIVAPISATRVAMVVIAWFGLMAVVEAQSPVLPARPAVQSPGRVQQVGFAFQSKEADSAKIKPSTPGGEDEAPTAPPVLTNAQSVAKEIERVSADESIEESLRERLLATLGEVKLSLSKHQAAADQAAAYDKQLSSIATDKQKAIAEANEELPEARINGKGVMLIEQMRARRSEAATALSEARESLQTAESAIAKRKQRLASLPEEIAILRRQLETLEASSVGELNDDPDGMLRSVRKSLREAQIIETQQEFKAAEKELALLESQAELLPLRKQAAEKRVTFAKAIDDRWREELSRKRQSIIEEELRSYHDELKSAKQDPTESFVLQHGDEWLRVVGQTETIDQKLTSEQAETTKWTDNLLNTQKQIEMATKGGIGLTSSEGLQLQLLRSQLPTISELQELIKSVDTTIRESSELKTELELEKLGTPIGITDPFSINRNPNGLPATKTNSVSGSDNEVRLRNQFINDLDTQLFKLADRRKNLESQLRVVGELREEIDSHIVWVRNHDAFELADFPLAWDLFRGIMHPQNLLKLSQRIVKGLLNRWELIVIAAMAIFTILFGGTKLRRRIAHHGKRAASQQSTSLTPTFATTLLSWALVLPLAGMLWVMGDALSASGGDEVFLHALAKAMRVAALAVAPLELLRQWLRKEGLAIAHFGTEEKCIEGLRRWLRILIDIGLPLLILCATAHHMGRHAQSQALSRLTMISGLLLISVIFWRVLEPRGGLFAATIRRYPSGWLSRLRHVWYLPLVSLPLIFAGIALMGYTTGAIVLVERLYWTLWLCLFAFYLGGILRRWLLTQRRRLVWAVHRERLEESERLGSGPVEVEPAQSMEAAEINAQTSRLIQTFLVISTLVGVAWIWSPVLPAVGYLDSIHLWKTTNEVGEIEFVTLADIVKALPILILTWVSVRNLPGLVEGVLLERLPLEKPVRYAITTLGTYLLMFIGIIFAAQTLGVRWDNIQWLVAALGVGLGFGLQEIFANFISGLILLFEQPIRVGDVVTLGDTTGVVARIRMRATTVTNWDRQELIIPNKDLITGRLVNWTLSDSTNRLVLNVGVAYGSDTDQACELLKAVCKEHPEISNDPAPVVTFEGFGDSTLDLVLRCYLANLDNRLKTTHELHTEINKRFNAAGLEMAFPQRDLHVRSLPPELTERLSHKPAA